MPNSFTRHQVLKEVWSRWCQKTRPISLPVFPPFWWQPTLHANHPTPQTVLEKSRFWCEDTNACTSLLKGLPWPCGISGPRMYVLSETSSETITNFANCHSVANMFHLVAVLCGSLQCAFSLIISKHLFSLFHINICHHVIPCWPCLFFLSKTLCQGRWLRCHRHSPRGHGSDKWAHFKKKETLRQSRHQRL